MHVCHITSIQQADTALSVEVQHSQNIGVVCSMRFSLCTFIFLHVIISNCICFSGFYVSKLCGSMHQHLHIVSTIWF